MKINNIKRFAGCKVTAVTLNNAKYTGDLLIVSERLIKILTKNKNHLLSISIIKKIGLCQNKKNVIYLI